ncbi:hypothetical protein F5Y10DRAFT_83787 [Nemania abortiva]|nr:hypothetical protein F5Y10DRAFT_83787 [Nemania abortiva]
MEYLGLLFYLFSHAVFMHVLILNALAAKAASMNILYSHFLVCGEDWLAVHGFDSFFTPYRELVGGEHQHQPDRNVEQSDNTKV